MWLKLFSLALTTIVVAGNQAPWSRAADEVHEGKVLSVGDGKFTILDNRDGDNDTFVVTPETKISRNGKSAKLSEIHPGDIAKVTATSLGGMLIAKDVSAQAPM